jgi:hypothetical protein
VHGNDTRAQVGAATGRKGTTKRTGLLGQSDCARAAWGRAPAKASAPPAITMRRRVVSTDRIGVSPRAARRVFACIQSSFSQRGEREIGRKLNRSIGTLRKFARSPDRISAGCVPIELGYAAELPHTDPARKPPCLST